MGLKLLAFDSSIATGSTLVDCKALTDSGIATVSGDGYIVTKDMALLLAAFGFGANLTRVQLQCPKFNLTAYEEIAPLANAMPSAGQVPQLQFFGAGARTLKESEVIKAQVIQSGASAENDIVLALFADKVPAPVVKEHFTIRFTGSDTLTANAWTTVTPTLDRDLPAGKYQIIGARFKSAGAVAFRFRIPGDASAPGGIASQSDLAHDPEGQRHGGWGVWGEFEQNLLPTIDALSTSADTSESGEIDLIGPMS